MNFTQGITHTENIHTPTLTQGHTVTRTEDKHRHTHTQTHIQKHIDTHQSLYDRQ